jgi:hypothetical protein
MFASKPDQTATNDTGEFAKFENFMKRLVCVPHEEIKAALDAEKEAKKRKRASRAASDKD